MSSITVPISLTINGAAVTARVEARLSLADFLRHQLELTGTHIGCEQGVCGACTVILDGRTARSCLLFAVQTDGHRIETIEGATDSGRLTSLQQAFYERGALQCGYCTPGMLLTAAELLKRNGQPDRDEIRDALAGNLCRCTGYQSIVDAVEAAAKSHGRGANPGS